MFEKVKSWVELFIGWVLATASAVTLNEVAIFLTIIYTAMQISTFIYPWHKKLWRKFGETHK